MSPQHHADEDDSFGGFSSTTIDSSFRDDYLAGTADYFPFIPNPNRKPQFTSLFNLSSTSHYIVEYNAERTRRLSFPLAPSRLSAVFAFATEEDAIAQVLFTDGLCHLSGDFGWHLIP